MNVGQSLVDELMGSCNDFINKPSGRESILACQFEVAIDMRVEVD